MTSRAIATSDVANLGFEYDLRGGPQALDPTGASNTAVALQAGLDALAANPLWTQTAVDNASVQVPVCGRAILPPGDYRINEPLRLPQGVSLHLAEGARIFAGAAMGHMIDTDKTKRYQKQTIDIAGMLDCNGLADVGLYARFFANLNIPRLNIAAPLTHGAILGDTTASATSYEPVVANVDISRPKGASVPVGSIGLHVAYATDGEYSQGVIQGCAIGVKADRGGNTFSQFHPWGFEGGNVIANFWDTAVGNIYIGCSADSPEEHGWRLAGSGTQIIGGRAYRNDYQGDGVGIAVYLTGDTADPQHFIWPLRVHGVNSSARWAQDINALNPTDMRGVTFLIMRSNVVSRWGPSMQIGTVPGETGVVIQSPGSGANDLLQFTASNRSVLRRFKNSGDQRASTGGNARSVTTKTADYTATNSDDVIICNSGTTITITLPAANSGSIDTGRVYTIRNVGAGSVTVATGGGNVDGAATSSIAAGGKASFMTDGTNWWSI